MAPARVAELDLLRGAAVAGMILVTTPGDWALTYPPLRHAEWNGWTLADTVFPAFLFGVGFALGLSFPRAWGSRADQGAFWRRVARRTAALVALGLLLEATYGWAMPWTINTIAKPGLANLRLPGILQRIGLCYALAAGIAVATARKEPGAAGAEAGERIALRPGGIAAAIVVLLAGYWALMLLVPVPGLGAGRLDPAGNLAGWIDRSVFGPAHLWPLGWASPGGPAVYDPEGLLSTVPAATTALFGLVAGWAWRRLAPVSTGQASNGPASPGQASAARAAATIGVAGLALFAAGLALAPLIPINKRIWTPSFALLSAGFAAAALAGLAALARVPGARALLAPLRVLGGNAVLAFVAATLLGRVYDMLILPGPDGPVSPRRWLDGAVLRLVPDPVLASTLCAVVFTAAVVLLLAPLHRRAFHFRL